MRLSLHEFCYRGSTLTNDVLLEKEISCRISRTCVSFGRLSSRVWNQRGIKLQMKLKVYNAVVLSNLLYVRRGPATVDTLNSLRGSISNIWECYWESNGTTEPQMRKFWSTATLLVSKRWSSEHNSTLDWTCQTHGWQQNAETVALQWTVQRPSYTQQTNEAFQVQPQTQHEPMSWNQYWHTRRHCNWQDKMARGKVDGVSQPEAQRLVDRDVKRQREKAQVVNPTNSGHT